jgi:hypothetical protein
MEVNSLGCWRQVFRREHQWMYMRASVLRDNYIKGQLGEVIAQAEFNLTRPHVITYKRLENLTKAGKLPKKTFQLIDKHIRLIDCLRIIEDESQATIEFFEVKSRLSGFRYFKNSRRKPKIALNTLALYRDATALGIKMFTIIVDFFPFWRYTGAVREFDMDDYSLNTKSQDEYGIMKPGITGRNWRDMLNI